MSYSRRTLLASMLGASGAAMAQTITAAGQTNIGFKADTVPERSECGIGALMPWADALWASTYNSHMKGTGYGLGLYRIDGNLQSERVHVHDGTHANRMIHRESNQCFIGPYVIDGKGNWKHIPEFDKHRLTSTMRHLTDPANRVYCQTMEGQFLEMDVHDLKPRLLFDLVKELKIASRPHFKGGFTAQGRVVVTNNGFYQFGDNRRGCSNSTASAGRGSRTSRTWTSPRGRTWAACCSPPAGTRRPSSSGRWWTASGSGIGCRRRRTP
jgi:hypothetical protein